MHNNSTVKIVGLSDQAWEYLESCARIRKVSTTRLIQRMVRVIGEDQMVLGVLDDDSSSEHHLEPGELTRSGYDRNYFKHP